uniref:Uncharacterized protein n=1 Tax=Rhizophora mucronata TaxID=61149 RepID=A0A2P2P5B4_RHIMU
MWTFTKTNYFALFRISSPR